MPYFPLLALVYRITAQRHHLGSPDLTVLCSPNPTLSNCIVFDSLSRVLVSKWPSDGLIPTEKYGFLPCLLNYHPETPPNLSKLHCYGFS